MSHPTVVRDRLLGRLTDSDLPVVVVSGPAGSGKSTLARQWADQDPRPHVTVAAGAPVDDPAALAELVLDALGLVGPPVTDARSVVTGQEPDLSAGLLPALTALAGSRAQPYVLVVDDVHLLEDPACHAMLRAVSDGVPPGSQIVLLSRWRTPDWLARARAEGRLLELRPGDLAFDVDEGARLFREHGVPVTSQDAAQLVQSTEGWAVGLYLTALSARERGLHAVGHAPRPDRSADYVTDYLTSEVLATLDEEDRAFLRRTSILDSLTASLCDAVLDRTDSAGRLADLAAQLQLVSSVDAEAHWSRYHHLLQAALRAQLEQREAGLVPTLHVRAARWYAEHGDLDAAVRHAKAADDLALTGRLIMSHIEVCIGTGRPDRLRQWLSGLDDAQLASDPQLALASAWSAMQAGDGTRMNRWLLTCETFAGADWRDRAGTDPYPAFLAAIHAVVGTGGLRGILTLSQAVLDGLPPDRGLRAAAAFLAGVVLTLLGDRVEGQRLLVRAEEYGRALDVPIIVADSLSWRGLLAIADGDRDRGVDLIGRASDVVHRNHLDRVAYAAHSVTAQALVAALNGPRERAAEALANARRLSALVVDIAPWFAVCGPVVQARAAMLVGDGATARALLRDARAHLSPELAETLCADLLAEAESELRAITVEGVNAGVLTPAELRVLNFLPSHLTFRQIGEHLFLSQNTVKTHALSVYRKLNVSSRGEAVTRAQKLGLLPLAPGA